MEKTPKLPKAQQHEETLLLSLLMLSFCLLIVGVVAPSFTMFPSFFSPELNVLIAAINPDILKPRSFSMVTAVYGAITKGEIAIGMMLLAFSILFPIAKLLIAAVICSKWRRREESFTMLESRLLNALSKLSAWSMLDVYVVAVFVAGMKEFPGGSRFLPEWGLACFAASIILSIYTAHRIEKTADSKRNLTFQPHK